LVIGVPRIAAGSLRRRGLVVVVVVVLVVVVATRGGGARRRRQRRGRRGDPSRGAFQCGGVGGVFAGCVEGTGRSAAVAGGGGEATNLSGTFQLFALGVLITASLRLLFGLVVESAVARWRVCVVAWRLPAAAAAAVEAAATRGGGGGGK
jgi:hypothetical protein